MRAEPSPRILQTILGKDETHRGGAPRFRVRCESCGDVKVLHKQRSTIDILKPCWSCRSRLLERRKYRPVFACGEVPSSLQAAHRAWRLAVSDATRVWVAAKIKSGYCSERQCPNPITDKRYHRCPDCRIARGRKNP